MELLMHAICHAACKKATGRKVASLLNYRQSAYATVMASRAQVETLTPDILLQAYRCGIFPMAESATAKQLHWYEPKQRGIIPLDGFHVSRSLAKVVRSERFEVSANSDFDAVIRACAAPAAGRENTWINATIRDLYGKLFEMGHCHTIEVRLAGQLVGGLYGVSFGQAFFGESMFHLATDASKVALVHLIARLKNGGYQLLDAQFKTDHLAQFGAIEIDKSLYQTLLAQAVKQPSDHSTWQVSLGGAEALALVQS
jgi:leucyl/phenylalanyl-tRNA---protein transferase